MAQDKEFIPYGRQFIDDDDVEAVVAVLRSGWLTQGPKVEEFEQAFAQFAGARYAVAVSSGTAALHIACRAAGLGAADLVATSPITFAASANSALYVGADPVFIDVDSRTANLNPGDLEEYIRKRAPLRAVVPVHYAGHPCSMPEIHSIAQSYGMIVIEDACHALGAWYDDPKSGKKVKVGSCRHSHMTVFSFHPVKHMTTGEGGMVTTNDHELYHRLQLFRSHGITRDPRFYTNWDMREKNAGQSVPGYYEMQELGFNFRLPDLNCALGLSQLAKVEGFVEARRQVAQWYAKALDGAPGISLPVEESGYTCSYHLYPVRIPFKKLGLDRETIMQNLHDQGIGTQVHYIPVHSHPYYKRSGYDPDSCPVAWDYYRQCLSLPMFSSLTEEQVARVAGALVQAMENGGKG